MSKKTFLLDTLGTEDKFEVHTKICNVLYDKIIKINEKKESVNIGLFGEWGSGKSFIIKKLKQKLEENKICVYEFDAWKFNGKELERSILFELEKQAFTEKEPYLYKEQYRLEQKLYSKVKMESQISVDYSDIRKKFKLLSKSIFIPFVILLFIKSIFYIPINITKLIRYEVLKFLGENKLDFISAAFESTLSIFAALAFPTLIINLISGDLKNFLKALLLRREDVTEEIQQTFSSEEFENIFKDMIKKIKKRNDNQILIIIDNIDRCEPKYAYEIITTIKTYMNINECIYIIPCDDEALRNYLKHNNFKINNRNYEQEFLDKFFNVNIRIPSPSNQNLDSYINECLNEIDIDILDEDKRIIRQILYYAYKYQTPRKIKRFINDYSMCYSLALEVDKEKKFILNDIEMFTIVAAIKQCWPRLEKKMLEHPDFRQEFYSTKSVRENIDDELGKDVVEFLLSVRTLFYNDKSIHSYLYYKESDNEINVITDIRNGKPLNMNSDNLKILEQEYKNYKDKNEKLYFENLVKSIFYSLKERRGIKSIEFKHLFNEVLLDINSDMCRFINEFTKEDFRYLDNIITHTLSVEKFKERVYAYIKTEHLNNVNVDNLIIDLYHSRILKYDKRINEYIKLLSVKEKGVIRFVESVFQNQGRDEDILNYIENHPLCDIIFKAFIEEDKVIIKKGKIDACNNGLKFILDKFEDDDNLIEECIKTFFNGNGNFQYQDTSINNNKIYNLGIFIFEKSKKYNINNYQNFIYQVLNNFVIQNFVFKENCKKIFNLYYYLTFLLEYRKDGIEMYKSHGNYLLNEELDKTIKESINLFGEDYFMEKVYINLNKESITDINFSTLIQNMSEEYIIKNYNKIEVYPINKIRMSILIGKIARHMEAKQILNSKLYESLYKLYSIGAEDNSNMLKVKEAYELLKKSQLLDCQMFLNNNILVNLYKKFPNEVESIIIDCIDQDCFSDIYINDILRFINKKLQLGEYISKYTSVCNILKKGEKMLNRNDFSIIESILKYISQSDRSRLEYDIAYKLFEIYIQHESIEKCEKYINDLAENGQSQFLNLINNNLGENTNQYIIY